MFQLDRLTDYDTAAIVDEVQRVASLISNPIITRKTFDQLSRVSSSTCIRRFGGWREALQTAGLGDRYGGKRVSDKMRKQPARRVSNEEILNELRRIADLVGTTTITLENLVQHSELLSPRVIASRFGSWAKALQAAGLELSAHGRRWTDDDYFENLLAVWVYYGRPPKYREMNMAPSNITVGAYEAKFGTWGRAKVAFIDRVHSDLTTPSENDTVVRQTPVSATSSTHTNSASANIRSIRLGLRYDVLHRDRFRCVQCGRSPATDPGCVLHVDHIVPFSKGGQTTAENLRTLCSNCNVGRGNRHLD